MKTVAELLCEKHADILNDGPLFDEAEKLCISREVNSSINGVKYQFRDGSYLTSVNAGHDIGFRNCWCYAGHGHYECSAYEEVQNDKEE